MCARVTLWRSTLLPRPPRGTATRRPLTGRLRARAGPRLGRTRGGGAPGVERGDYEAVRYGRSPSAVTQLQRRQPRPHIPLGLGTGIMYPVNFIM
jgi:hypothetical protein